MMKSILSVLTLLALSLSSYGTEVLLNGDFEGESGWSHSSNVSFKGEHWGVDPTSGSKMAVLAVHGYDDAWLSQPINLSGHHKVTISFMYKLKAWDWYPGGGPDRLTIRLGDYLLAEIPIDDLWDGEWLWGFYPTTGTPLETGWLRFEETYPVTTFGDQLQNLMLRFDLENLDESGGDTDQMCTAYLDEVSADAAPEPATIVTMGLGLLGAAGMLRRSRRRRESEN